MLTQGVMIGAALAAGVMTARVLGPDARGLYSLCVAVVTTAGLFGSLEIGQSMVFFRGRRNVPESALAGAVLLVPLVLSVLTLAAIALAWPLLSRALGVLPPELLYLALGLIPISLSGAALRQVFRAFDDFTRFNALRVGVPISRVVFLGGAFLMGAGVRGVLLALFASEVLVFAVGLVILVRRTRPDFRIGLRLVPGLMRFGARLESATALGYASNHLTVFAIAAVMSAEEIAYYAIADGLVQQLSALPMIIGTVMLPKITGESESSGAEMSATTHRVTLALMALLCIAVSGLGSLLITGLYGDVYAPAVAILGGLLTGAFFHSGSRVLYPYFVSANRIELQVGIQAVTLTLHVALLVYWIPSYGIAGAAWALASARALRWILSLGAVRVLTGIPLHRIVLIRPSDIRSIWVAGREQLKGLLG